MAAFVLRRLGHGVVVVFAVVCLTFVVVRLVPGDPARLMLPAGSFARVVRPVRPSRRAGDTSRPVHTPGGRRRNGHRVPSARSADRTARCPEGDAGQRALVAWSMGWESAREASGASWMIFFLSELMFDDYDAIRYIAYRSLKSFPAFAQLEFDHMKPREQRDQIIQQVMATWQTSTTDPARDERLLFDRTGTIRFDIYQALRAARDNRTVVITE